MHREWTAEELSDPAFDIPHVLCHSDTFLDEVREYLEEKSKRKAPRAAPGGQETLAP